MTAMPKVAGLSRLRKELMQLDRDPPPGIICYQKDDNDMTRLESYISGPPESPYQAGRFRLDLQIPEKYPFEPPQIRFHTKIYHPNIDDGGRICADILKKGKWVPSMTISSTLLSLAQLMAHPNPDDPLDADIAKQFQLDYPGFLKKAKEWTLKYAHDEDEDDHQEDDKENTKDKSKEDDVNYHSQTTTSTSTTASLTRKTNEEQVDDQEEDEVEETIKPKKIFSLSRKKTGSTQPSSPSSLPPIQKKNEINTPLRLTTKKKTLPHSKTVTDKKKKDNDSNVDKKEPEIMELDDSDVDTDVVKKSDNNNNDNVSSSDNNDDDDGDDNGDNKKEPEEKEKEGKDADHDNHNDNDIAIAIDSDDDGTDDDSGNGDSNGSGENIENDNDNYKKEPEEKEKVDSTDVDMDDKDNDDSKKNSPAAIIDLENDEASSPPHEALDLVISESPFYIDTTRMRLIVVDGEEPGSRPLKRKKLNLSLSRKKKKM